MRKHILSGACMFLMSLGTGVSAQNITDTSVTINKNIGSISSVKDGKVTIPVKIGNKSIEGIENVTVTVKIDGTEKQYTVVPTSDGMAEINILTPSESGIYDFTVSIDKVNGSDNKSVTKTASGILTNLTRTVEHKVVFEEFTGFGCGWCPRGLVALEEAREMYGRGIVLISAHYDDPISCRDYNILRQSQLPSANLDRKYKSIDPYFGTSGGGKVFGINDDIKKCAEVVPVAEVKVDAVIEGDVLLATSDVKFLYTGEGDYAVAFVLTEDGIHGDKWSQLNNYWQVDGMGFVEEEDPRFERWIKGESKVKGYVYDDVALAAQGLKEGIDNSIPASFVEEQSNTYEVEFNLAKLKKMQNRKNLNVCAFLYDRTKKEIVNAEYMSFEHETAVEGVHADDENVYETDRYTIDGHKINSHHKGINIIRYSDGTVKKMFER